MKQLLTLAALVALCYTGLAQTRYVTETVWGGAGTLINANSTTNLNLTIDSRKADNLALQVSLVYTAACTDAATIVLQKSIDGTTWCTSADTQGYASWTVTPAGATQVSYVTNVAMNGFGYLRLTSIANGHATLKASNVVVSASKKINVN